MSTAQKCERCREYNAAAVDFRNQAANAQSDLAALRARHNALVEAVAWERECDVCGQWLHLEFWANDDKGVDLEEIADIEAFARAEVNRLLQEEK